MDMIVYLVFGRAISISEIYRYPRPRNTCDTAARRLAGTAARADGTFKHLPDATRFA
jgi:hypothetical protein